MEEEKSAEPASNIFHIISEMYHVSCTRDNFVYLQITTTYLYKVDNLYRYLPT